jgi:mono/diheme cytochrome c family protein
MRAKALRVILLTDLNPQYRMNLNQRSREFRTAGYGVAGMVLALVMAAGACLAVVAAVSKLRTSAPSYDYRADIEPILIEYCFDCHGDGMDKGSIALDQHEDLEELLLDRSLWEHVYNNVDGFLMPPGEKPQPSDKDRDKLIAWIERDVFQLDPENPDPGRVTIRRLNREEYNNTMRDLVGVDLRPADDFPADDTGYGFDTIGDVLSLSPALLERYFDAAGKVLDAAMVTEAPAPKVMNFDEDRFRGRQRIDDGNGHMSSTATVGVRLKAPEKGSYRIEVMAGGSQSENIWPNMRVAMEGGPTKEFTVDRGYASPGWFGWEVPLTTDERWLDVSFTNDHYDPKAKDPTQRDRNLNVMKIRVVGPLNQKVPVPSEVHRRLLSAADPKASQTDRARAVIRDFGARAWRRPLTDDEAENLLGFFEGTQKDRPFDSAIKLTFQAILVSPKFLFRGEAQPNPDSPDAIHPIDEYALASRLSYFLWSSMPDRKLMELAASGKLRSNLRSEVTRMLADEKAGELTENFAGQWLQLRNLDLVAPDSKRFPAWNNELRDAMRGETERFFAGIVSENRSVLEFLDSNYTWVNEPLARHYGLDGVKGDAFQKVSLTGETRKQRGGVLSHASVLTITSNPTRTSAVNRGNWVLENLLGTPPPPPPDDVPALEEAAKSDGAAKSMTLRQQLEKHREDVNCAACHARMDPIGFGLENFDAIGAWRNREEGQVIDASGKLYTGETFNGPAELRSLLAEQKQEAFVRCLSEALLTYASGRGLEYYDKPALGRIVEQVEDSDFLFHELVFAVVESVPFQKRRGDWASLEAAD